MGFFPFLAPPDILVQDFNISYIFKLFIRYPKQWNTQYICTVKTEVAKYTGNATFQKYSFQERSLMAGPPPPRIMNNSGGVQSAGAPSQCRKLWFNGIHQKS